MTRAFRRYLKPPPCSLPGQVGPTGGELVRGGVPQRSRLGHPSTPTPCPSDRRDRAGNAPVMQDKGPVWCSGETAREQAVRSALLASQSAVGLLGLTRAAVAALVSRLLPSHRILWHLNSPKE